MLTYCYGTVFREYFSGPISIQEISEDMQFLIYI